MSDRQHAGRYVWAALTQAPWAITAEGLSQMLEIADRAALNPKAISKLLGNRHDEARTITMRGGVATLPVRGPLIRYGNLFSSMSGATSYELVARDFTTAIEDRGVKSILLSIDSPGGEVNGCQELAELIYQARGIKPVVAHVTGLGCSAAYQIASAADRINIAPMAVAGCLGVRMLFVDTTRADEEAGLRRIEVVSSQTPRKDMDPAKPEGLAAMEALCDSLAEVFLESVTTYRGVTREVLDRDYGRGGVLVGAQAVAAGLADVLSTYEELHAELEQGGSPRPPRMIVSQSLSERGTPMKKGPAAAASAPTSGTPAPAPKAEGEAAGDCATCGGTGKVDGEPCPDCGGTGKAKTTEAAAPAPAPAVAPAAAAPVLSAKAEERKRITDIQALPAAGAEDIRAACVDDENCSVDAAARRILEAQAKAQKAQGSARVDALKKDETSINAPTPLAPAAAQPGSVSAVASRILGTHRALGGRSALPATK